MSRKIDALIAGRITKLYYFYEGPELVYVKDRPNSKRQTSGLVPNYSTDIAAAWEVINSMPDINWTIRSNGDQIEAFMSRVGDSSDVAVIADTVPMALCLAALRFMGINYEEEIT